LVFEKNANYFADKLSIIAENCDHNIDPWSPWTPTSPFCAFCSAAAELLKSCKKTFHPHLDLTHQGLPDAIIFQQKIPIWVNF
jgi:hypothetical protein